MRLASHGVVFVVATILSSFLVGCWEGYSGDGRMIDNGPLAATERYILNLGGVNLGKRGLSTFRMKNLPSVKFNCGIALPFPPDARQKGWTGAIIAIRILDENGQIAWQASGPLQNWPWATRRDSTEVIAYAPDPTVGYFLPKEQSTYQVQFEVLTEDTSVSNLKASIELKSGGWK